MERAATHAPQPHPTWRELCHDPRVTGLLESRAKNVELIPARRSDEATLENLLSLYLYDFSEITEIDMNEDGSFEYDPLSTYWDDAGRYAFLIHAGGQLAGFVLVHTGSVITGDPEVFDVAQFFVLRAHRRSGVGMAAAYETFERFAGVWEVRVIEKNHAAQPFWEQTVSAFTSGKFERFEHTLGDSKQVVYRFRSPAA